MLPWKPLGNNASLSYFSNSNLYQIIYKTDLGCKEDNGTKICGYYEGPCANDNECFGILICGICSENFLEGTNCCREPYSCHENHTNTETCCSDQHQCYIDQGNCQDDSHCSGILQCGNSNCGDHFPNGTNCCEQPSTTEGGNFWIIPIEFKGWATVQCIDLYNCIHTNHFWL